MDYKNYITSSGENFLVKNGDEYQNYLVIGSDSGDIDNNYAYARIRNVIATNTDYAPYGYLPSYKKLLKVSDVCQLLDKRTYYPTETVNGVTFTNNGDGTITLNGTATIGHVYFNILSLYLISLSMTHKYLIMGCPANGDWGTYYLYADNGGAILTVDMGQGSISSPTKQLGTITICVAKGFTVNNVTFKPQLFDLTEMYGAGNEPKTVEEFKAKFPNELYDYSPRCWEPSCKTAITGIPPTEYGYRFNPESSDPAVERVIRKGTTINKWDVTYTANTPTSITENPFEKIDIFCPQIVYDKYGNKFSRFVKFYLYEEDLDGYHYVWVCRKKANDKYYLPDCFLDFGKEWDYVDIGCYEGSIETIDGVTRLCSKSGKTVQTQRSRATDFNQAKANNYDEYQYTITTMGEYTQILSVLADIMLGTRNTQSVYSGLTGLDTGSKSVAAYDSFNHIIYFTTNVLNTYRVGYQFAFNNAGSPQSYGTIVENGSVVGNITDGVFVASDTGTTYYYIRFINGSVPSTLNTVLIRPAPTGFTDTIDALCGRAGDQLYTSFKLFGVENVFGNTWRHILDVTIKDLKPYRCLDLNSWAETSTPENNSNWSSANYTLSNQDGYVKTIGYDKDNPSVKMTTEIGTTSSTYYADYYYQNGNGAKTVFVGGDLSNWSYAGLRYWGVYFGLGSGGWNIAARLSRRVVMGG